MLILEYEASVAGGVPIIRSIKEGLIANKINKSLWNFKWNDKLHFIIICKTNGR